MNLFTEWKQTHRLREGTYGYQERMVGGGGGIVRECGINMYTLLYLKLMTKTYCITLGTLLTII